MDRCAIVDDVVNFLPQLLPVFVVNAKSLDELIGELPEKYQSANLGTLGSAEQLTVFLTGATGFLGAFLVRDILERTARNVRLIAHVRGVKESGAALERLRRSLKGYGLWKDEWTGRLSTVVGDLSKSNLGIDDENWTDAPLWMT